MGDVAEAALTIPQVEEWKRKAEILDKVAEWIAVGPNQWDSRWIVRHTDSLLKESKLYEAKT